MKTTLLLTMAGLLAISFSAFADPVSSDPQDRLGWDNVGYFKQTGELSPPYPTVAIPKNPDYTMTAEPSQRMVDDNYHYFDSQSQSSSKPANGS